VSLTFEQPWFLLLLALAIPVAISGLAWLGGSMSRARAITAIVARAGVLTLVTLMLAGATAVRTTDRLAVVVVVDVSESVTQLGEEFTQLMQGQQRVRPSRAIRSFIDRVAAGRGRNDLLGVVVFDGSALAVALPTALDTAEFNIARSMSPGSDIAGALRLAESLFPADAARRIVLISDGNATGSDPVEAARELAALGTPIDVIPLPYSVGNEVMVEAVDVPPQAARGQTIAVRVLLRATDAARGSLRLIYEDQQLDVNPGGAGRDLPVQLSPGVNAFVVEVPLDRHRVLHRIRPVFIPADASSDRLVENNTAEVFTVTPGPGRVLIVLGSGDQAMTNGGPLARAMDATELAIDVVAPDLIPTSLLALQSYSLIVLQNVAAPDLPRGADALLCDYVTRLGGGLIMVGGRDSFGAGGWLISPLAELLPVRLEIPDDVVSTSAAVALVIDRSGSMLASSLYSSKSQIDVATEAAAMGVLALGPNDSVTVISFSHDVKVEVPLQPNTDPRRIAERVRSISANGGTSIKPALVAAYEQLKKARTDVRHIIFLTDGMDYDAPNSSPGNPSAAELAAAYFNEGITTTTIGLGGETDTQTLRAMAEAGGGVFYEVMDPTLLPKLFVSEVRVARQPLIRDVPFQPRLIPSGSPVLMGLGQPPEVGGLVLTMHRDEPTVVRAIDHPDGFPLLAHWFAGRGQVAVFTSDAGGPWTAGWSRWNGATSFWRQLVRTIARPTADEGGALESRVAGDALTIRYESVDQAGRPRDLLSVEAQVYGPDGTPRQVRLSQTGPGVYEATTDATEQGSYVVVVSPSEGGRPLPSTIGGVTRALSPEFQSLRSNVAQLQAIATATGGRLLDPLTTEAADVFERHNVPSTRAAMPIWPMLLVWCVGLFVLDVATRRIAWDRLLSRELAAEFRLAAGHVVRARAERAAATVAALRQPSGQQASQAASPARDPIERTGAQRGPLTAGGAAAGAGDGGGGASPGGASAADRRAAERSEDERRAEQRRQALARLAGARGGAPSTPVPAPAEPPAQPPRATGVQPRRGAAPGSAGAPDQKSDGKPAKDAPPVQNDGASSRSSLLDAKRRARSRYAGDEER
jgi:Ca-activated chloride channel family protein